MLSKEEFIKDFKEKHIEHFIYLYERWQDEKKYEDFNDYIESMKLRVPGLCGMTQRPFAFYVPCSDETLKVSLKASTKNIQLIFEIIENPPLKVAMELQKAREEEPDDSPSPG